MDGLRNVVDEAEGLTASDYWALSRLFGTAFRCDLVYMPCKSCKAYFYFVMF